MGLVTVKMGQFHLGAAITREAIDEMGLKQGDQVTAVVKATEVMVIKEALVVEPAGACETGPCVFDKRMHERHKAQWIYAPKLNNG